MPYKLHTRQDRLLRLIAQHSNRVICYYDLESKSSYVLDPEICAQCRLPHLCERSLEKIISQNEILPESQHPLREMFDDIHAGSPSGSLRLHCINTEGERRWFDMRYSTIYDQKGKPIYALISSLDITEQYEHELTHLHFNQGLSVRADYIGLLEADLTTDTIEKVSGKMSPPGESIIGTPYSFFADMMINTKLLPADRPAGAKVFMPENLLQSFHDGHLHMQHTWQMLFNDGKHYWVKTKIELFADPYNGHIRTSIRVSDVTTELQTQMELLERSKKDGMTGLLNKVTAKQLIREHITFAEKPGILIIVDLDDLKTINDTFGHAQGDRAIINIAETMKKHFRESDIISRIGGDEFLIYLTGAAENSESIAISITSLLRKLATLPIGGNDERRIHCSIGCAIEQPGDDYESLYKKADLALYHVKRNGKNDFAFYTPDMEQADYQFRHNQLLDISVQSNPGFGELENLLNAISTFYPLILSLNLSENNYMLIEISDEHFSQLPTFGIIEDISDAVIVFLHPEDAWRGQELLSRNHLLEAYQNGERVIHTYLRCNEQSGHRWIEVNIVFYTDKKGSVCEYTLMRWADEHENFIKK